MKRCTRCSSEVLRLAVFCQNCQHPNSPDLESLIHKTLNDRFLIYRYLSEGGLSTVFAAIDLLHDTPIVVKVSDPRHLIQTEFNSPSELADAQQYWLEMNDRMKREVAALMNINHPNIVKVYSSDAISDDLRYVVMELLHGRTLRDELNSKNRLPYLEAGKIAAEVAQGLKLIHSRGIIHRDLTPRNIFLCDGHTNKTPAVKLIDFGIARFPKAAGVQTYTQHAIMAGTPGYASPEQSQNLIVDHRADIYSLGITLYEMVTGQKPFAGRSATEIALKQLRGEPMRPRDLVPDLPLQFEALILRAMAREPNTRHSNIEEFYAELSTLTSRLEIPVVKAFNMPEPSGTEVFRLLTAPSSPELLPESSPTIIDPIQLEPAPRPKFFRRVAASVIFLLASFATLAWFLHPVTPPASLLESSSSPVPTMTPTLRPDVIAPRRSSPLKQLAVAENIEKPSSILATLVKAIRPKTEKIAQAKPTPTIISKPIIIPDRTESSKPILLSIPEPTPRPAPTPVVLEARATPSADNSGWKRQDQPQQQSVTVPTPETKAFSWQGRVNGVREITLDMPGTPGSVDIPSTFRKRIGIIEPPSPSNKWRKLVLRVFGDGDVSFVVRWMPRLDLNPKRQELVRWN